MEIAQFDVEAYIQNYSKRNAVNRLLFIADKSPELAENALVLAITRLKQSLDVSRYEDTVERLKEISPSNKFAAVDQAWIDTVTNKSRITGDKLELELKSYKNNLIKESIRMGNAELGNFYLSVGDLANASKYYSRQREYCTTHKHVEDMSMDMIRVAVLQSNWSQVESSLSRIDALPSKKDEIAPYLNAVRGLLSLSQGLFQAAANILLKVPAEAFTKETEYQVGEFTSMPDIGLYIGLCAIATFSRSALKDLVDNDGNYKDLSESHPHIRQLLESFIGFDYKRVFATLDAHAFEYKLDIYASGHVDKLLSKVRENCYVQYVSGYKTGYLSTMAVRFGCDVGTVESEIIELIEQDKVKIKLKLDDGTFVANVDDQRANAYRHAMAVATGYERNAKLLLVSINVLSGGLEVNAS
ncbi:26S proteasome subunit RPN7-domain-containing protein [Lipomyces arxii]|uniref:26S proteasome subunit RPN7-domain-containing protein n=1 Tax=Lipomyces arxii TaxID=56418 RepID=UPI0034CDE240